MEKKILTASAAVLVSMQPTSVSAQFVPRLNLCIQSQEGIGWRLVAEDNNFQFHRTAIGSSGKVRNPSFYVRYSDTGKVSYRLDYSTRGNGSFDNHYVYADGQLILTAGKKYRTNGNRSPIGHVPPTALEKMKSAKNVEIRVTRSYYGEPEQPRGSITVNLGSLRFLESSGRNRMERLRKDKEAGRCN